MHYSSFNSYLTFYALMEVLVPFHTKELTYRVMPGSNISCNFESFGIHLKLKRTLPNFVWEDMLNYKA